MNVMCAKYAKYAKYTKYAKCAKFAKCTKQGCDLLDLGLRPDLWRHTRGSCWCHIGMVGTPENWW